VKLTRRDLFRTAGALGGATVIGGLAAEAVAGVSAATGRTTLTSTLRKGAAGAGGGHRRVPPYGMGGGLPGDVGRNWVERADGSRTALSFADQTDMSAGDVFVIETPGGGGYGK
jgi:N-methylhydantoinase B/oxoprolinase/acetone carboxylase alpha subunit